MKKCHWRCPLSLKDRKFCHCCNRGLHACNNDSVAERLENDSWSHSLIIRSNTLKKTVSEFNDEYAKGLQEVEKLEKKLLKLPESITFEYRIPEQLRADYPPITLHFKHYDVSNVKRICITRRMSMMYLLSELLIEEQLFVLKYLSAFETSIKEKLQDYTELLKKAFPEKKSRWWW